jgi:hypothetical protein
MGLEHLPHAAFAEPMQDATGTKKKILINSLNRRVSHEILSLRQPPAVIMGRHPMPEGPMSEVTRILSAIEQGDPSAAEQLLPLVYDELRRLATAKRAQE